MKKLLSILTILTLVATFPCSISYAQEDIIELSVPKNMPENYIGFYWVGGTETNGVTFVVNDVYYDENVLKINVSQLPNDDYTSLVDNQVDTPPDDTLFLREIETASQFGKKILGTLCDIQAITDEKGNNLLDQYHVATERNGSSLTNEFSVYLPSEKTAVKINIKLVFGVNEDLSSHFSMSDSLDISIPALGYASTR